MEDDMAVGGVFWERWEIRAQFRLESSKRMEYFEDLDLLESEG
jgi:hypothetical protein